MDQFNEAIETYLEPLDEGILDRLGQRVRNVGRTISKPFKRLAGDSLAMLYSNKGYKKVKTLESMVTNMVTDLEKLGVVIDDPDTEEQLINLMKGLVTWEDDDLSKFGKKWYKDNPNNDAHRVLDRHKQAINLTKDRVNKMFDDFKDEPFPPEKDDEDKFSS